MSIDNTTNNPHPEWVLGGNPRAIERQEAEGQQQLIGSSQLPLHGMNPERAAQFGVEIIGVSPGDTLFLDVKFPPGVEIHRTEHSMWTELFADGKKIASIFYKAAFYDRRAHIEWEQS